MASFFEYEMASRYLRAACPKLSQMMSRKL